ncbi:MAG: hypothetical protein LBR60_03495 [Fibrobacter sp.]|jgi:hypothetical protein|nr:hypothetical protein [Fibrobacter sp.]
MKKMLFICAVWVSTVFGNDTDSTFRLHLSSFPSHAEVFLGERPASFARQSTLQTPVTLEIPRDSLLFRLTLFKMEFADTTLDVKFKRREGDQYLMIMLSPETSESKLERQQKILDQRRHREWGKNLTKVSAVPLLASLVFAGFSAYHFDQAEQKAKQINRTWIRENNSFNQLTNEFHGEKKKGKDFRNYAAVSLGLSLLLFSAGIYFYF